MTRAVLHTSTPQGQSGLDSNCVRGRRVAAVAMSDRWMLRPLVGERMRMYETVIYAILQVQHGHKTHPPCCTFHHYHLPRTFNLSHNFLLHSNCHSAQLCHSSSFSLLPHFIFDISQSLVINSLFSFPARSTC